MLKLFCGHSHADEQIDIFYSLPFNLRGERARYAHSFPMIYFQMRTSPDVNMGKEYWDYLGQSDGTYEGLLQLMDEIGTETKKSILPYL